GLCAGFRWIRFRLATMTASPADHGPLRVEEAAAPSTLLIALGEPSRILHDQRCRSRIDETPPGVMWLLGASDVDTRQVTLVRNGRHLGTRGRGPKPRR